MYDGELLDSVARRLGSVTSCQPCPTSVYVPCPGRIKCSTPTMTSRTSRRCCMSETKKRGFSEADVQSCQRGRSVWNYIDSCQIFPANLALCGFRPFCMNCLPCQYILVCSWLFFLKLITVLWLPSSLALTVIASKIPRMRVFLQRKVERCACTEPGECFWSACP